MHSSAGDVVAEEVPASSVVGSTALAGAVPVAAVAAAAAVVAPIATEDPVVSSLDAAATAVAPTVEDETRMPTTPPSQSPAKPTNEGKDEAEQQSPSPPLRPLCERKLGRLKRLRMPEDADEKMPATEESVEDARMDNAEDVDQDEVMEPQVGNSGDEEEVIEGSAAEEEDEQSEDDLEAEEDDGQDSDCSWLQEDSGAEELDRRAQRKRQRQRARDERKYARQLKFEVQDAAELQRADPAQRNFLIGASTMTTEERQRLAQVDVASAHTAVPAASGGSSTKTKVMPPSAAPARTALSAPLTLKAAFQRSSNVVQAPPPRARQLLGGRGAEDPGPLYDLGAVRGPRHPTAAPLMANLKAKVAAMPAPMIRGPTKQATTITRTRERE